MHTNSHTHTSTQTYAHTRTLLHAYRTLTHKYAYRASTLAYTRTCTYTCPVTSTWEQSRKTTQTKLALPHVCKHAASVRRERCRANRQQPPCGLHLPTCTTTARRASGKRQSVLTRYTPQPRPGSACAPSCCGSMQWAMACSSSSVLPAPSSPHSSMTCPGASSSKQAAGRPRCPSPPPPPPCNRAKN